MYFVVNFCVHTDVDIGDCDSVSAHVGVRVCHIAVWYIELCRTSFKLHQLLTFELYFRL